MAPTIRDVAKAAGVSVATASKGLNGKGRMRPETRQRIVDIARDIGFRANRNASSLTTGRTFTVGLLTRDGYGRFTPPLLGGVEDALSVDTASLILCDARRDAVRERHYVDALVARRVDGLIVTGRATDPAPPLPRTLPFPVLYAYTTSRDEADSSLTVDDEHGGWLAARQLVRQGCRTIAHITGPASYLAVRERVAGARRAFREHGLDLPDERVLHVGFSERAGYTAVERLLASTPGLDGIFCGSDQIGRGVADALGAAGVAVPGDVALVGFDNWTLLAAATRPPLTSVDMNLYRLGRAAGESLLAAIDGDAEPGVRRLPCSLAIRASCPALPGDSTEWTHDTPLVPEA
ncbi:LacI family DNA-binding transcriptional regulator [Plantactinospora sp. GCM10030261]|uniref:LacI family DNA-binding transcriptional regulator n=1 Tax=Plantactinospora sp. GCM10030261 TaxID=3273420 RepID=UPI003615BA54